MTSSLTKNRFKSAGDTTLGYTETLTYGHYTHLKQFASKEAHRIKRSHLIRQQHPVLPTVPEACEICVGKCHLWCHVLLSRTVQDWTFLTLLGFMVALLSFTMDVMIEQFMLLQRTLFRMTSFSVVVQYIVWVVFHLVLICFSTGFTHIVGPTAIGSGIPEVKTIMKGVVLKEYLTLRTLVAKVIGLTASLGSGLPLGKVGPFVHVASVSAAVLSKFFTAFKNDLENEARSISLLTAASAVGVSCTFAAPIGGVLFSIEATAIYFAVRNYWRGFYSAICGALMFRLLAIWFQNQETLTALFKTNLRHDIPYDPFEMAAFIVVGAVCGMLGALWVFTHKNIVLFIRRQTWLGSFLRQNRFIYPSIVTIIIASVLFPAGSGQYMGGWLSLREAVNEMFDNRTWSAPIEPLDLDEAVILNRWRGPWNNVLLTLAMFFLNKFWMCAIATTLPVPCGIFIPAFALGASLGRLSGEIMAVLFPGGIRGNLILPGAYAVVGAAAFSGAVTHTVSPAIIVFELTGQMGHVLPCVLAVMVANATAHYLQPSLYDAMIIIKKLPFLPASIDPDECNAHRVCVNEFMVQDIHYLTLNSTYEDAYELIENHSFRAYPLVDNKDDMTLLGSIQKSELERILNERLSNESRVKYFNQQTTVPRNDVIRIPRPALLLAPQVQERASAISRFSISRVIDDSSSIDGRRKSTTSSQFLPVKQDDTGRVTFAPIPREEKSLPLAPPNLNDHEWEHYQLNQPISFEDCVVDQAPFQISEKTTLYRTHALFSLLSLHHTFVTNSGRLVGIVSLSEVRKSIQGEINGPTSPTTSVQVPVEQKSSQEPEVKELLTSAN